MSCNVCILDFNKSTRLEVQCEHCEFSACRSCCVMYITGSSQQPQCMGCKKEWGRAFLVEKFTKKFMDTDYKALREKLLWDQQRALLPATQPVVEELKHKEELRNEAKALKEVIRQMTFQLEDLNHRINSRVTVEKKTFVRPCGNGDCRGFLSQQWKCGLCETHTCKDCHEVKGEEHECNPDNVKTADMMNKETKPCPKCGTRIFKISGCDQMFCTHCHTAFNWRTGRMEFGAIHNPHYFDFLRNGDDGVPLERNPDEVQCGREIDHTFVRNLMNTLGKKTKSPIIDACRDIIHNRLVVLPRYNIHPVDNEDLRIKFLRNQIDEKRFRTLVQQRDKNFTKRREFATVVGTYVAACTDIVYRFATDFRNDKTTSQQSYVAEIKQLRHNADKWLTNIAKVYNVKSNVLYSIRLH